MMRDPLARVQIRYKLPLAFVFLTAVALGLGGYVTSRLAREALREQIRFRLDERASAISASVDRSLESLRRRVVDFASDGFLRQQFARLGVTADPTAAGRISRYLDREKLVLVDEFADAYLLDAAGQVRVTARGAGARPAPDASPEAPWTGPIQGPARDGGFPWFVLSAPVYGIEGDELLGRLQVVVRADRWASGLAGDLVFPGSSRFSAELASHGGLELPLTPPRRSPEVSDGGRIRFSRSLPGTGWQLALTVDGGMLSIPLQSLVWKFRYLGLAFVLLAVILLFFPQRFFLKPLAELQSVAGRIAAGDFSARVTPASDDEVGRLAGAFNFMAAAVEERTRKLEQAANTLARRESDIRFERDRLNAVIRSMEDGLFILDREGNVTLANAAARPLLHVLSQSVQREVRLHCGRHGSEPAKCMDCIAEFDSEVQGCVVRVDSRIYEINGAALTGPSEAFAGKVFVSRDVTDRIRESERLAHQERLSVLGEIAAVMAHELNNPLAAISMFSQMLLKGLDSGSALRPHAEVIHRNTESCKATIRALLDMATTSSAQHEELSVRELVDDVLQLLGPVAQRAGVTLSCGGRAVDPTVIGDELQLRQALVNLAMNAIQAFGAVGRGSVVITSLDRGDCAVLAVEDDGPGIPAEVRAHIFEPFFTTKPPGEGTGLGLPTSRRIVEAHGGTLLLADAAPGRTRFEIAISRGGGQHRGTRSRAASSGTLPPSPPALVR